MRTRGELVPTGQWAATGDDGETVSVVDALGQEDAGLDRACDQAALDTLLTELEERDRLLVTLYRPDPGTRLLADARLTPATARRRAPRARDRRLTGPRA